MATKPVNLTTDVTDQFVLETDHDDTGFSLIVTAGSSLGGGTLSVGVKPVMNSTDDAAYSVEYIDATLAAGDDYEYRVGGNQRVYLKLASATDPDIDVFLSTLQ